MNLRGPKKNESYWRSIRFDRKAVDTEQRTVELSFSSEEPYERDGFGGSWMEILGHGEDEMDLSRFESGGHPLLLQHDPKTQIGVIERAWLDDKEKKGRAVVRFAKDHNPVADMVYKDVLDGIRSLVSVGYSVHEWKRCNDEDDEDKKKSKDTEKAEEDAPPTYRATRWECMEVSIVSIPADFKTIGVGREAEIKTQELPPPQDKQAPVAAPQIVTRSKTMDEPVKPTQLDEEREALAEKQAREKAIRDAQQKAERESLIRRQEEARVNEIYSLTEKHEKRNPGLREKAMSEGWSVDQVRAAILDSMNPTEIITGPVTETKNSGKSVGQIFVDSPQYRQLVTTRGQQRKIFLEVPRTGFGLTRAYDGGTLTASTEVASYLASSNVLPGIPGLLDQQQLRVAQVFPAGSTTAHRIVYLKEDSYTQYAAGVAEGAQKPGATLSVSEVTSDVKKVAVVTKVTEEFLADYDAMRSYIDARLSYMVQSHEDDDLLNGTSAANEVVGILQTSGIQTQAVTGTVMDAIGLAIGKVRNTGHVEPTAIIMNSQDWTDLSLTKDSAGQYLAGGPFMNQYGNGPYTNVYRLWGIPVVITSFIAEGTALVGAFNPGAQLFRRSGLTVTATNSNEDDFLLNLIAIRAESRMALCVYKPLAFCSVTGIA